MSVLPRRSRVVGYAAAVLMTGVVTLARLGLADWLLDTVPFLPFVGAVAVVAWVGGLGPGLLATLLGSLAGTSLFLGNRGTVPANLAGDVLHVTTFLALGSAVSLLCEALHRSRFREREGHRKLAATLDGMGDAFFQLDADWRLTAVNRQYESDWGLTAADLVGRVFWDEWPEAVGTPLEAEFRRVAGGGAAADFELQYGATGRWYRVRVQPTAGGGLTVFSNDVTPRVRQQAELLASHEQFSQLADTVPQIVYVRGPAGEPEYLNRRWVEYTGLPEADAADLLAAVHPADLGGLKLRWEIARAARVPLEAEFRLRRYDGAYRWFLTRAVPVPAEADPAAPDATRWVGTSTDVHDQREAAERLEVSGRRKDEFLATLAHELRNPLAPIRNGLAVLKLGVHRPEAVERTRAMMERQLEHLVVLVDDLLDVSRVTQGKLSLRRRPTDLAEAVALAVEAARPLIDQHGHALRVECPAGPVRVDGDPTRLAQVVGNLLTNSAKYTPPGGRIAVTLAEAGGVATVTVTDDGVGIPAESLEAVFEMFSQVDRALEKATGGLGIGLALVKGLVEMHGGTVAAASGGPGRGSTFTVRLPALPAEVAPPGPPAAAAASAPARRWRVLVVDDNADGADSLGALLELSGHEVRTAYDGLQAVAAAGEFRPDLILMDVGMPRLNGLDATRRIRAQDWGRAPHIVALTGMGQEQDRRNSAEAGADGHLVKPVAPATVLLLLSGLAGGATPPGAGASGPPL